MDTDEGRRVRSVLLRVRCRCEPRRDGGVLAVEHRLLRPEGAPAGQVVHHAFVSNDRGVSWTNVVLDRVAVGEACVADGCSSDFYIGHSAVAADDRGDLVYLYDGATRDHGPQRIFARRSTDEGLTWTGRQGLSRWREHATSPAVESTGGGDVRAWYAETVRGSHDAWDVLVPVLVERRPLVDRSSEALGCEHGGRIQVGGRIPGDLRRLWRDRDHERRPNDRGLGRRLQLDGPGVEPGSTTSCSEDLLERSSRGPSCATSARENPQCPTSADR